MELPYYMTPLIGALAWGVLLGPKTGLVNQAWRSTGAPGDLFDVYSPWGIAWVMALFEGTVAFVMISAAMKSMDPSLEESSRVLGAGKLRTALRVTLPLVAPGVLSATIFVFAEMLGSFAAAFVLGIPGRFYVVTTVIWQATLSFPPDYGRAAAMGLSLFGVMLITLTIARFVLRHGTYTTITGKAFRPREMDVGIMRWPLLAIAWGYIVVAVILPLGALLLTSFERFATVVLPQMHFTLANYETALQMGSVGPAFVNSLILGLSVATIGVVVIGVLAWIIYRSRMPGSGAAEYVIMFPQAVPRLVFGLGLLWAWINMPIPIYGTLWLLALAYFTVFLPLGLPHDRKRRAAGRSEPGGVRARLRCRMGLSDAHRDDAVAATRSGRRMAADLHCIGARTRGFDLPDGTEFQGDRAGNRQFVAELEFRTVRGNGVDPDRDRLHRRRHHVQPGAPCLRSEPMNRPRIEVADLVVRYGDVTAVDNVSFDIAPGEMVTLLGPSGCGKTTTLRAVAGLETPSGGTIRLNGETVYSATERRAVPAEKRGVSMVFQSYAIWPHMTVFENVAYGLRVRKLPQAEVRQNVQRVLEMVQMQDFADRPASKLSGGQQQRVAVARAIAFSPSVLLFDEPLSNLDAKLRAEMRVELRELQRRLDITSLYVTHDQEEALAISDRVIVMNGGRIEQIGTPEDIYNRPRTRFAADFVGSANLIAGKVRGPSGTDGTLIFDAEGGMQLEVIGSDASRDQRTVALRSSYIHLGPMPDSHNAVTGRIHRRMFHGDFIQYVVDWPAGQLIVRRPPTELFDEGSEVTVSFAPEHCVLL
jgi:ABC-type Fe3+/spermidine/putrescine transport system ATPase subunit/ABC-type spermidine/putrescine transport system permease subunit II